LMRFRYPKGVGVFRDEPMRRAANLPEEIHAALIRLLFTSLPPVVLLSLATLIVGAILAVRSHDAWFLVLTLFAATLSVGRVALIVAHNSARKRWRAREGAWETAYAVLSVAFGANLGSIAAHALALDDLPAHVLVLGLVLPYTAGLIARTAVRPVICMGTMLAVMLPVMATMAFRDDVIYPTLTALFCLYLSSGIEMTRPI